MNNVEANQGTTKKGISGSTLKIIAMVTMLIDHIGAALLEIGYMPYLLNKGDTLLYEQWADIDMLMRLVGRMAFPIFCFLLVEGYFHTKDVKKYLGRLFLFALISEVPFDLAFSKTVFTMHYQNVFFTLFLGLLGITIYDKCEKKGKGILSLLSLCGCGMLAVVLNTDYSFTGVVVVFAFYLFYNNEVVRNIASSIAILGAGAIEIASYIAYIPIHFYNGERGLKLKYVFYIFYPLHLLILVLCRMWFFA